MVSQMRIAILCCFFLLLLLGPARLKSDIIHKERSLYSNVIVKKIGANTCLQFTVRKDTKNQSCFNPKAPERLVFAYAKMTMASILLMPEPKHILFVGLGGGTLPMAFHRLFPTAVIHAIEIDTAVTKVAKKYFDFTENDRIKVFDQDGRVFTKRALANSFKYDLIILDAFNGDYIPEHLMTQEYLQENKAILSEKGLLASNTFTTSALYDHESTTYASVFDPLLNFKRPETNNRILFAPNEPINRARIVSRAKKYGPRMAAFNVPIADYAQDILEALGGQPDWNTDARVLTDQYSPANLLNSR